MLITSGILLESLKNWKITQYFCWKFSFSMIRRHRFSSGNVLEEKYLTIFCAQVNNTPGWNKTFVFHHFWNWTEIFWLLVLFKLRSVSFCTIFLDEKLKFPEILNIFRRLGLKFQFFRRLGPISVQFFRGLGHSPVSNTTDFAEQDENTWT